MLVVLVLASLVGCGKKRTVQEIHDKLIVNGIPEKKIKIRENQGNDQQYDEIFLSDSSYGYATIRVFKNSKAAKSYWNNIDERYNNLKYIDSNTAVGDLKDVCDASIEEWIYYKGNVVASVEQCCWSEWSTYIGDDGIEYYADGTPVETVPTDDERRQKASKIEKIIMNILE